MAEDERVRAAIHDVLMAGGTAQRVVDVVPADRATARRLIDLVMTDYVTQLNRALSTASTHLYGTDASSFMRQYDTLWQAKLLLSEAGAGAPGAGTSD